MKKCGIYKIISKRSGRVYVGQSIDISRRWKEHKFALRRLKHDNDFLQTVWSKFGEGNFEFLIIELCEPSKLTEREQYWIDELKSYKRKLGFNLSRVAGSCLGYKHTNESKKRMSEGAKRRTSKESWKLKHSEIMKKRWKDGKYKEASKLMSKGNSKPWTDERKEAASQRTKDQWKDPDKRKQMSEAIRKALAKKKLEKTKCIP